MKKLIFISLLLLALIGCNTTSTFIVGVQSGKKHLNVYYPDTEDSVISLISSYPKIEPEIIFEYLKSKGYVEFGNDSMVIYIEKRN